MKIHAIKVLVFYIVLSTCCTGASSLSSKTKTSSFWNDASSLASLDDPPSPERLALIQASPYRGGFEPASDNINPYKPRVIQGSLPPSLKGSLATNGPGRIRIGDTRFGHWFDGDGYVTLVSFDGNGKATFCAKYVRTKRFQAQEQLMSKMHTSEKETPPLAFSGAWTAAKRGHWYENIFRIPTNPSNTATMWLSSSGENDATPRLYCLCEGGHPVELDPSTLETISSEVPFKDDKKDEQVKSFFSAHFSRDTENGDIYNHGYILNPLGPARLNLMRLAPDGTLLSQKQCDLPFDTFVHDSTLSQHYLVYFLPPFHNPPSLMYKFLLGLSPIGKLYQWDPSSLDAYVHVHSKSNLELQWTIRLPNSSTTLYHLVDAHDEENADGTITLQVRVAQHVPSDRITLEQQFADQYSVPDGTRLYTTLREYTFQLHKNGTVMNISDNDVCEEAAPCEFPAVNTEWKPHQRRQYCWTNALSCESQTYLDGIQKVDMQHFKASPVVTFGEGNYAGPPAFVPKQEATAEDDGYIIVTVYKSFKHLSDIVILDAATLKKQCTMELTDHVPYQFHGDFLAGFVPEQ